VKEIEEMKEKRKMQSEIRLKRRKKYEKFK